MYNKILVGIDGSKASYKALERAIGLAEKMGSEIILVTAVPPIQDFVGIMTPTIEGALKVIEENAEKILEEAKKFAEERGGKVVETIVEIGGPGHVIVEKAKEMNVDLIVVGRRGTRSFIEKLIGSVTSEVVKHADRDVLVVEYYEEKK